MKKYSDAQAVTWDAWFVRRGQEIHAFYLQNGPLQQPDPRHGWAIGHAISRNGLDWSARESVLPPLLDEKNPMDFHSKFTGCAVNREDVCYLFYTMRDRERGSQRIGVSVSRDWEHFEPWEGNPVVENCNEPIPVSVRAGEAARWGTLIGFDSLARYDWNIVDCRDFIVVEQEDGTYLGYYAAAADLGGSCPVGVIVMVRSKDLLHWKDARIVYSVPHHGVLEVPDVFLMNGKWVLTCLSGMNYSGRAVSADPYACNVTITAYADSPEGPFEEVPEDNILIAGPVQSGFTCRSVLWNGERLLYYIDRAAGKNAFSLPKRLCMDEGNNRVHPHFCSLLKERFTPSLDLGKPQAEPNSFAWKTYGGSAAMDENDTLCLQTYPNDYHAVSWAMPKDIEVEGSVMLYANVTLQGEGAGLFLRTAGCPYMVLLEPKWKRIALWRLYSFECVAARSFDVQEGKKYAVRCLLIDDVIELYVDDILVLQCGLPTHPLTHLGFAVDRGTIQASEIEICGIE